MSKDPCVSFFGNRHCNFVARYDVGEANLKIGSAQVYDISALTEMVDASKPRTYVHDICTSCGKIVKRSQP